MCWQLNGNYACVDDEMITNKLHTLSLKQFPELKKKSNDKLPPPLQHIFLFFCFCFFFSVGRVPFEGRLYDDDGALSVPGSWMYLSCKFHVVSRTRRVQGNFSSNFNLAEC